MAHIYSRASMVISWLGPADRDSDHAVPLMKRLLSLEYFNDPSVHPQDSESSVPKRESLTAHDTAVLDSIAGEQYESLTRFLARQYFFRCWVLQEVMLAHRICMLCGTVIVDFSELRKVASLVSWIKKHRFHDAIEQALALPIRPNRYFNHERAILELYQNRSRLLHQHANQEQRLPFTFEQLLNLARMSRCGNPKDKIFALLGIVPSRAFGIVADYNKTTEQVYVDAIKRLIQYTKSFDCLSWVTDHSARKFSAFPSWVGEFGDDAYQSELAFTSTGYNASWGSKLGEVDINSGDDHVLGARGVKIDHLVELAEPWEWHTMRLRFDPRWITITLKLPKTYLPTGQTRGEALITTLVADEVDHRPLNHQHDMDQFKNVVRRLTSAAVVRHLHYISFYAEPEQRVAAFGNNTLKVLEDLEKLSQDDDTGFLTSWAEVWHTEQHSCTCNADMSHFDISIASLPLRSPDPECPYIADFDPPKPGSHPYRSSIADRIARVKNGVSDSSAKLYTRDYHYSRAIEKHARFRRLARTGKGYLGLVPASSEIGDAVWLLQGASVPFVLRKAEQTVPDRTEEDTWKVMGDAYIHGAMQGEVWQDVKDQLVDIDLV